MSQENVEIVREVLEAQRRQDWQAFRNLYDPDIAWEDASGLWGDWGNRRGFADVQDAFMTWFEAFEHANFELEDVIDVGDDCGRLHPDQRTGRESGLVVDQRISAVWTLRDRRVVRVRGYRDEAEALEAAGLSG
jgi:ketosteroid isomerase-like protein